MKKKLLALTLCVCTVFSMSACGKKDSKENSEGSIKLGSYTGYTVGESVTQVDDADVQDYIDSILKMYASTEEVKEGTTAEGDKVNVTYHAVVNGQEVETSEGETTEDGSSAGTTQTVTLSEEGFTVSGFTDGLIGKNVGETVEMDLQYPDDYQDTSLAGQPVHYSVVINFISVTSTPEYNDAFVSEHYSFAGYTTAEEFTNFIKKEIYYIQINNMIWDDILDAQKVESYPSDELKDYMDKNKAQIESAITSYGYTMDAYYQVLGKTEDEFNSELEEQCKKIVKEKMFVRAVAEKEDIKYNEEAAAKYAAISGFTSVDEFETQLEAYGEELEYSVLSYLVQNYICESANVVSDEETTAEETTTAEESEEGSTEEATTAEEGSTEETTTAEETTLAE